MNAVPYCRRCSRRIDPSREKCPKCGGVVRFRFVDKAVAEREDDEESEYIRPPWRVLKAQG